MQSIIKELWLIKYKKCTVSAWIKIAHSCQLPLKFCFQPFNYPYTSYKTVSQIVDKGANFHLSS